jgi:hypothetical protein
MVHDPARNVEEPLPVTGEQCDQQRRAAGVEIGGPTDLVASGEVDHGGDQLEQLGLVIGDAAGEQHRP